MIKGLENQTAGICGLLEKNKLIYHATFLEITPNKFIDQIEI
jgi:hypothetical protein